jgi:TPP-dependent pyruvate/acetoin dehydrogenase alpha subunit
VDGNDVLAVYEKAKEAVLDCRSGRGPVLIEGKTYRHGGHHVNDPGTYMPREKLEYFMSRDPVKLGRQYLLDKAGLSEKEIAAIETEIEKEMDEAIEFAKNSPEPSVERFLEEAVWY